MHPLFSLIWYFSFKLWNITFFPPETPREDWAEVRPGICSSGDSQVPSCSLSAKHPTPRATSKSTWQAILLTASEPSCRIAAQPEPPQGDPAKEGRPATVSWHFPWLLLRNSWTIIEGYSGIPIGLTGGHILNRMDTKSIQLLECYYSLRNLREVSDADL